MKSLSIIILFIILENIILKSLKRHKTKTKNKQLTYYQYTPYTPSKTQTVQTIYTNTPVNSNLQTPLTTGWYSSGGNIYYTDAPSIPYGTGYSYGPWQKIKN